MVDILTSSPTNTPSEDNHAIRQCRNGVLSVGKRKRKRGCRPMGRYPLRTAIREYMNATRDFYAPKTVNDRECALRAIDREFAKAREENQELKAEPRNWGEREVMTVILQMRERGLSHSTQRSELTILRGLLRFLGNPVFDQLKAKNPHVFPKPQHERKPSLSEDQLSKVLRSLESISGWRGECMRFMFWTYAHTGLRLSELIQAEISDLDLRDWTLRVGHPKGERTYGQCRKVPIPEPLRPIVSQFLKERERLLTRHGIVETMPLVFWPSNPEQPIAKQTVESWAHEVRERSGVAFTPHTLRRTYGQNLLNRGASIETVSIALGHSSTVTTEKHYCRKDADLARLEILKAYERSANESDGQFKPLERERYLPGYA